MSNQNEPKDRKEEAPSMIVAEPGTLVVEEDVDICQCGNRGVCLKRGKDCSCQKPKE